MDLFSFSVRLHSTSCFAPFSGSLHSLTVHLTFQMSRIFNWVIDLWISFLIISFIHNYIIFFSYRPLSFFTSSFHISISLRPPLSSFITFQNHCSLSHPFFNVLLLSHFFFLLSRHFSHFPHLQALITTLKRKV